MMQIVKSVSQGALLEKQPTAMKTSHVTPCE